MKIQPKRDIESEFLSRTLDYLVNNGLENISMRELCKTTGMSIGSLYYWFDNKDELIIYAAKYGLSKVSDSIFEFVSNNVHDIEHLLNSCLEEISKHRKYLRTIYQIATSPHYGSVLREHGKTLNSIYYDYGKRLSNTTERSTEDTISLVYIIMSVSLDYVIWDDMEKSKIMLNKLYKVFENSLVSK